MENEENIVEEAIVDTNEIVEETTNNVDEVVDTTNEVEFIDSNEEQVNEINKEAIKSLKQILKENPSYQEEFNSIVGNRVKRIEKKYAPLKDTLKAGMGLETDDIEEITNTINQSYEEQGFKVPKFEDTEEEEFIGEARAKRVISLGDEEMQDRFTELYRKYESKKISTRELAEMTAIGQEHANRQAKQKLIEIGAEPEKVINNPKFREFASQFNVNVPIEKIYTMYQKENSTKIEKPVSAGSIKGTAPIKVEYTEEEFDRLSKEDLDNPTIWKAVRKSMSKW